MKLLTLNITLALAVVSSAAAEKEPGWKADPRHPDLQFRVKCHKEAATILWRNNYPGEVTLKINVRSSTYDGGENVTVAPNGTAETPLETEYCSPTAFRVDVARFSMAPPPPPPPATAASPVPAAVAAKPAAPKPPVIVIPPYQPPQKLPTVPVEAVTSILVGMDRQHVLQTLGQPTSGITIPDDHELRETLRYSLPGDRSAVIRLSNGAVVEVAIGE